MQPTSSPNIYKYDATLIRDKSSTRTNKILKVSACLIIGASISFGLITATPFIVNRTKQKSLIRQSHDVSETDTNQTALATTEQTQRNNTNSNLPTPTPTPAPTPPKSPATPKATNQKAVPSTAAPQPKPAVNPVITPTVPTVESSDIKLVKSYDVQYRDLLLAVSDFDFQKNSTHYNIAKVRQSIANTRPVGGAAIEVQKDYLLLLDDFSKLETAYLVVPIDYTRLSETHTNSLALNIDVEARIIANTKLIIQS
jgi:hypothetical protein